MLNLGTDSIEQKVVINGEEFSWADVFSPKHVNINPTLGFIVRAALSILHGPHVESSFNLMGDILDCKSSQMSADTLDTIQTGKYHLKGKECSAVKYFTIKAGEGIDKVLCSNIKCAAGHYKKKTCHKKSRKRC